MKNLSIKSFLTGCFLTALILIPLFYWGLKQGQVEIQKQITKNQEEFHAYGKYMVRMVENIDLDVGNIQQDMN